MADIETSAKVHEQQLERSSLLARNLLNSFWFVRSGREFAKNICGCGKYPDAKAFDRISRLQWSTPKQRF